jgi:hypothetical protein
MRLALKFAMMSAVLAMTSACGQHVRPRTVSDFCLAAQRISAEPAPVIGADDPGNRFDTDDTLFQVLEHNAVMERLCPAARPLPTKEN